MVTKNLHNTTDDSVYEFYSDLHQRQLIASIQHTNLCNFDQVVYPQTGVPIRLGHKPYL